MAVTPVVLALSRSGEPVARRIAEALGAPLHGRDGRVDQADAYFPNALLEYDVATQRLQMDGLPQSPLMCLNGFLDTISVLIGHPKMYLNSDKYSPITILSGEKLSDERFILCLKSYGLQTEFWCLSQKLTEDTYQVSEQWTAGISVYCCV